MGLRIIQRWGVLLAAIGWVQVWALDESRLWLPAQYQKAMPALIAAAGLAENSQRCEQVINGKMLVSKNTDQSYYFVITCRDKQGSTFNLSYQTPLQDTRPVLVAEQRRGSGTTNGEVIEEAKGIAADQVLTLCRGEFPAAVDALDDIAVLDNQISKVVESGEGFSVSLPFTAQGDLGHRVLYAAHCSVTKEGNASFRIELQREGALTLCQDHLRSESIFLGRSSVVTDDIVDFEADSGFHFHIPFHIKTLAIDGVHYMADCRVSHAGESELTFALQPAGAFTICQKALKTETLLMKGVEIDQQPVREDHQGPNFFFEMAFAANSPDGNPRKFRAFCNVDAEGDATISTELDKTAIIAVCIHGVGERASEMIDARVLPDEVPPLQEDNEGYFAEIPFDARDPNGKLLHYKGECRVDESGRTRVKLKPRYL